MSQTEGWYVVKQENGQCAVVPADQVEETPTEDTSRLEQWGPYTSREEAIARRVGLIRAGKCQPA
ncbi:MAG: hypothetical protein K6T90_02885 [Leptolyngbyaceae cyanobacterium HOT.MB2.61]|jgi:hypothetical protein|nr:hypothetical protein [Leptolyngbyaceae cyanobacterium HOT.MB2.61]